MILISETYESVMLFFKINFKSKREIILIQLNIFI